MTMINMMRCFHPVGQGAFYSESIDDLHFVYDCGTSSGQKNAETIVEGAFPNDSSIEILFISHFDQDHVSLIPTLRDNYSIKHVVMPFLHEEDQKFYISLYKAIGENSLSQLIEDPQVFFGSDTKIFTIKYSDLENGESLLNLDDEDILNSKEEGQISEIDSGSRLTTEKLKSMLPFWCFIPYTKDYSSFSSILRDQFFNKNRRLFGDVFCSKIQDVKKAKADVKKIRDIYEIEIKDKINEYSMFLYSGPYRSDDKISIYNSSINRGSCFLFPRYTMPFKPEIPVGCIYTGDGNLKGMSLKDTFSSYKGYVGTIQVPHHGSRKDFNDKVCSDFPFSTFFPVSYGTKNRYRHPHYEVIQQISRKGKIPIFVNENVASIFFQQMLICI